MLAEQAFPPNPDASSELPVCQDDDLVEKPETEVRHEGPGVGFSGLSI